ncbi:hypothetical protein CPAST_c34900 [Clostridium pasteurianum DSM 525 = ATCC 6013]|uniref:Uncharacterized protein n=1 Tax=Clostridium pasteurianum DSM 525 = ATCC 6013 TaxID=1262449 RepID=A0A0H3J6B5_CLOPA|nr:hypothetical protein [Clostridium pasteurianum]AJA49551.1 hypothetical protein CPAST_c34900 [Clostridium pasteurianum DSM 525 = ATCC 6013]AJA53539.1 hypothetical protein CLPA_c34900 [Clostridium pasteurianum DSM 525 = ATCC 6013]KRU14436.1 hypothetical protein CP6013_03694 [Clostridium pasteurianum DSM 525 = ATCC 6013]
MKKKFFNLYQANIFIEKGAICTGCGIEKYKAFVEFEMNDLFNELQYKWDKHILSK